MSCIHVIYISTWFNDHAFRVVFDGDANPSSPMNLPAKVRQSQPQFWGVCAPVVGAAAGDAACEEVACVRQEVGCHEGAVAVAPACYPGWICHTAGYHLLITTTIMTFRSQYRDTHD